MKKEFLVGCLLSLSVAGHSYAQKPEGPQYRWQASPNTSVVTSTTTSLENPPKSVQPKTPSSWQKSPVQVRRYDPNNPSSYFKGFYDKQRQQQQQQWQKQWQQQQKQWEQQQKQWQKQWQQGNAQLKRAQKSTYKQNNTTKKPKSSQKKSSAPQQNRGYYNYTYPRNNSYNTKSQPRNQYSTPKKQTQKQYQYPQPYRYYYY